MAKRLKPTPTAELEQRSWRERHGRDPDAAELRSLVQWLSKIDGTVRKSIEALLPRPKA